MDINVYLFIVIALMLLIIMYLLFVLRRVRTQLALIKDALEDIKGGNLNRRILAGENDMTKTICYDINKIAVNSQAQLIRQRQSEQAYKRLMTSLSHDVKTPLASLVGYLEAVENKIVTSLFLPIVLSMFATTLFFDEQKNDTLKGLLIIPISKTQLYFSKIAVVIFMSLALCLLTFAICILGGFLAGGFTDLNTETILQAGLLFLAGGVLVPLAMLPVIFLATLAKGYVLPIGAALLYLVPVVLIPSGIMGLHPLASVMGIYPYISSDAAEMVKKWAGGIEITISPNICLISLLVIGSISAIVSVLALRKQTY